MPGRQKLDVVIDTPRRSRNKYAFDESSKSFRLSKVLPAGYSFPYDFGFVPGTEAPDGDPLDVLVLTDEPTFPGCVVAVRLLGAFEAEQTEKGKTTRNDRLVAVAEEARDYAQLRSLKDIEQNLREELEHFFVTYHQTKDSKFKILNMCGPTRAATLVQNSKRKKPRK
jgi:inorganic pyrophosphatase